MAIKLGELLVRANLINEAQLKAALSEQQKWGGKLGEILVRMSFCTEDLVVKALSKQLGIPRVELDTVQPPPESVLHKVPVEMSRDLNVVPLQLKDDGKTLVVAASDPTNLGTIDMLRAKTSCKIVTMIAGVTMLNKARNRFYYGEEGLDGGDDSGFKLQNSAGNTMVKAVSDIKPPPPTAQPSRPPPGRAAPAQRPGPPTGSSVGSPAEVLEAIEAVQRKEVSALKAMVELLIEKGVFTREEYFARVKR